MSIEHNGKIMNAATKGTRLGANETAYGVVGGRANGAESPRRSALFGDRAS